MDLKAATETLTSLTASSQRRTKTALLRSMLDQVEAAFAAGLTHATVLESLNQHGLDMNLATFEVTIRRLRTQKAKRVSVSPPPSHPSPSPSPAPLPPSAAEPKAPQGSLDPADLDAIFRSQPDMNKYAKIGRERLKKK